jgi:hypothetical protein
MTILYIGITKTEDGERKSQTLVKATCELPDDFKPADYVRDNYPGWSCTGWREFGAGSKAGTETLH